MKLSITMLAAGLLFSAYTNGQAGMQGGLRLNPEYTSMLNSNDANAGGELKQETHFTYISFGAGLLYNFSTHTGFGMDILFSREGQGYSGHIGVTAPDKNAYSSVVTRQLLLNEETASGDFVALAELNYFKIPLMLSFTTDNSKPLFLTLLVGPQMNLLFNVAQEVNETDLEYPNTDISPKDLYKSFTISGMLAAGGGINLTSALAITARLRFDYGFQDAENKDAMVSYFGAPPVRFYGDGRKSANTLTEGLMVAMDFRF